MDEYKDKTDEELVSEAGRADTTDSDSARSSLIWQGAKEGRGAMAELLRRLRNSIEKLDGTTSFYSKIIIVLTVVLVILTLVLVFLTLLISFPYLIRIRTMIDTLNNII